MTSFRRNRGFRLVAAVAIVLLFLVVLHLVPKYMSRVYRTDELLNNTLTDLANGEAIVDPDSMDQTGYALNMFQEQSLDELKEEQNQFD